MRSTVLCGSVCLLFQALFLAADAAGCDQQQGLAKQCCLLKSTFTFTVAAPGSNACCGVDDSATATKKLTCSSSGVTSIAISLQASDGAAVPMLSDLNIFTELTDLTIKGQRYTSVLVGLLPDPLPPSLTKIDLSGNYGFGGTLKASANLGYLDLSRTKITIDLNTRAEQFPKIVHLEIDSATRDFALPFLTRPNMEHLALKDTPLNMEFPSLETVTKLSYLKFNHCGLKGQFTSLAQLTSLKTLIVVNNPMLSPFPSLSRLTNLEYLDLYFNGIYGPLPHFDPLALAKLTDFVVPHNWLTGPISNLAVLTSLTYLEIDDNSFSGPLKPIFQLTNLIDTATVENNLLVGEIDQFTKDWLKKYSSLDEPNCFTTTTGEFHNPQSKLLCPQNLAVENAKRLPACAKTCAANIKGWNAFNTGQVVFAGKFGDVCTSWKQDEWDKFTACHHCSGNDLVEADSFITSLSNLCSEHAGTPLSIPVLSQNPIGSRGMDYVAQTIAYVENMVNSDVTCWSSCVSKIPNYNAIKAATTPESAFQEFVKMCTNPPLSLDAYHNCMMAIKGGSNDQCRSQVDAGRAYAFESALSSVCPPPCSSNVISDCFCGSTTSLKYIEPPATCPICSNRASTAGYHCYNPYTPPIPVCSFKFCTTPSECYCNYGERCIGSTSYPNGRCIAPPKATVAIKTGTTFRAGNSIPIDISSNAWDNNAQTMSIQSISLSDGTTTIPLDKDTCWGKPLNTDDFKKHYLFTLPATSVSGNIQKFRELRPPATGQRCSGPAGAATAGIALPNPSIVYTLSVTVHYSPLTIRRAIEDPFVEEVVSVTFTLEASPTSSTLLTTSTTTTKSFTSSTQTRSEPGSSTTSSTTSGYATSLNRPLTTASKTTVAFTTTVAVSISLTASTTVTKESSTRAASESVHTSTSSPKKPDIIINVGSSAGDEVSIILGGCGNGGGIFINQGGTQGGIGGVNAGGSTIHESAGGDNLIVNAGLGGNGAGSVVSGTTNAGNGEGGSAPHTTITKVVSSVTSGHSDIAATSVEKPKFLIGSGFAVLTPLFSLAIAYCLAL